MIARETPKKARHLLHFVLEGRDPMPRECAIATHKNGPVVSTKTPRYERLVCPQRLWRIVFDIESTEELRLYEYAIFSAMQMSP